jgi:hypothetical protein
MHPETFNLWIIADILVRENFYWCLVQWSAERIFILSVLSTDEAHFARDGIINIRNEYQ